MKKTNFFSAKALAMVACVSLMFTSCDEENFSVTPVDPTDPTELPDASVVVSVTTVDIKNRKELDATYSLSFPYTVQAGADGAVAATTLEDVTSSVEGYYTITKDIKIPAVAKGHMVYIPTVFYTSATDDDATVSEPTLIPGSPAGTEIVDAITDYEAGKTNVVSFETPVGYKLADYAAVEKEINALSYADGRAATDEAEVMARVKEALKNLAQSFKTFKTKPMLFDLFIPENTASIKTTVTPVLQKGIVELSTTQDGKTWTIEAEVEIVAYCRYSVVLTDGEGHSHAGHLGHGNGNGNNAGGGEGGR